MNDYILIALQDPLLVPEATHAAAAAGMQALACDDPRDINRHAGRARAIVADRDTAAHVGACATSAPVFFLAPEPGPIDYEAALGAHAAAAFIVPAEAPDFLAALGGVVRPAPEATRAGRCLAVVGTAGGVGTSTFAAALARQLAPSVLVDARPLAGGLDLLLGLEDAPGARWPDLRLGTGTVEAADVRRALPATPEGVAVLSGARSTDGAGEAVGAGDLDAAVQALRGQEAVIVDGAVTNSADHVVILAAAEVRAAAAAAGIAARLRADNVPHSVVLRHRGWSSMTAADVEAVVHADVAAELPTLRGLPRAAETAGLPGTPPRALRAACARVLEDAGWA